MKLKLITRLVLSTLLLPSIAYAEDDTSIELDNVEVTATRQAYQGEFTQLETPQAELKITEEVLKNAGAINLNQALDLSASVARQNNFGGLWNSFAIRGFVGDGNLPSNYLVNGFNAGRGFGGPRDLSGVESVEVLKGPRAALFGRGEPGGTINLVTKRPTFEKEGEVQISAGSFDTYRTDVDYTTPLSDNVAIRLVGFYEDAGSFRDKIKTKKQGLSPSITFLLGEKSQLTYELEYSDQEIPFDRGVIAINNKLGVIPESRFLGEPSYGPIDAKVLGHQVEFQHDFNDDWSALVGFNYRDTSIKGFASENGFSAPDAAGNFGRFSRYRDYDANYYVMRAEIAGSFKTGDIEHRVLVGVDADKFKNDQFALRDRATDQSINIFNPVYGQSPISSLNLTPQIDRVETQESVGFYAQDQISLTEKWDVRLGARFDDYKQKLENRRSNTVSKYDKKRISPQLGVVYNWTDAVSVYSVYGENFRPLSGATDTNNLDPNQSKSTELGVNFTLNNGAVKGNVAIFNVKQSNIASFDGAFNNTGIGKAESKGFEFDLIGKITDNLNLLVSYAYVDAETKNEFTDGIAFGSAPAGSDLINIPENQLSLQLTHSSIVAGRKLLLTGGALYVDDRNGQFDNQDFRLPSYTTVRVQADYEISKSLAVRAEINNLFDKEYYTNSYASVWVQPGAPINGRVALRYSF